MNYVEKKGGLGNQLFQYAFSKFLEKKTGRSSVLQKDFFTYVKNVEEATKRELRLDKFDLNYVSVEGQITCSGIIREDAYKETSDFIDDYFYSGYWQNKSFFIENAEEIRNELDIKVKYKTEELRNLAKEISECNSVAVHLRRGDYLSESNKKIFNTLSLEYYKKAYEKISEIQGEKLVIYFFTDDKEYAESVKDGLFGNDVRLMPDRKDYEDLYLMTFARHHIIANSSFSWWGAAASKGSAGCTVSPREWLVDRPSPDL